MSLAANVITSFTSIGQCCTCGVPMVLSEMLYLRAKRDSSISFYCELGHKQSFSEGENQRLKKQIENERRRREWADENAARARAEARCQERRASSFKGHLTRTKNRISAGVCPCCNRTFKQLARHMKSKHPKYLKDEKK